jgi:hypothetical protein
MPEPNPGRYRTSAEPRAGINEIPYEPFEKVNKRVRYPLKEACFFSF